MAQTRYIPNINQDECLSSVPDPREQLIISLRKIVRGSPPRNPWTDTFKPLPQGLWTGPTSSAYLFLWLSITHPDLRIDGRSAIDWCHAYLDCGQADIKSAAGLNDWGIKNEFLAWNAVKAAATQDMTYARALAKAITNGYDCPAADNEHWSGRAGALALLRIIRHWVPQAADIVQECMTPLIEHILKSTPWRFHGHNYIGAAHGVIGIIAQVVLCKPREARSAVIEAQLTELLDLQTDDGHWYITEDPGLGAADLVHICHGSPGFLVSLMKIKGYFAPEIQARIDSAVEKGKKEVWEKGLLRKEPNLCHGLVGNMLALTDWKQREHFMSFATAENIEKGLENGEFVKGDDRYGLLWGEAGRAWGWMMIDSRRELGYPSYTDI